MPDINESTSTRLMYAAILFIGTFVCVVMMSPYLLADILFQVLFNNIIDLIFFWYSITFYFQAPSPPQSYLVTSKTTSTTTAYMFVHNSSLETPVDLLLCEDDDLGGPNCPSLTGPIAVYRFSFAMVLFFSSLMVLTLGVSTSKSFRAKLHNGFWFWKFLYAFFLISLSFKLPFFKFGIIKTGIYIFILKKPILIDKHGHHLI